MKNNNNLPLCISILTLILVSILSMGFVFNKDLDEKKSSHTENKHINNENANSEGIKWLTIEEAYEKNKVKQKKIFIDVYTSWCGWCKKMNKTTFGDKIVSEYANKYYYAVKLDAESVKKVFVLEQYTTPRDIARSMYVNGYPTIVFMHEDFKTIDVKAGYKDSKQFLQLLVNFKRAKLVAKK